MYTMTSGLKGKVAIVTGGGSGIGAAVSRRLAAEGVEVVVADIAHQAAEGVAAEILAEGGKAHPFAVDVADAEAAVRTGLHLAVTAIWKGDADDVSE